MKVLMLGWEFPPFFAGGVGIVCHSMTRALAEAGAEITYVMPRGPEGASGGHVELLIAGDPLRPGSENDAVPRIQVEEVAATLVPYAGLAPALADVSAGQPSGSSSAAAAASASLYGANLLSEINRFADAAVRAADGRDFDVIHAHDWTTFRAGLRLRQATGRPLLVHVHITEFDKSGGEGADPAVYAIEREGMLGADLVVCVSEMTRDRCVSSYGVDPSRCRVVHNAADPLPPSDHESPERLRELGKVVLFLGRVTRQKGPDLFLEAAARVLEQRSDVTFVVAGSGDMLGHVLWKSAELGIGPRVVFSEFVNREQASVLYDLADIFVMPSVSEPFGIVALEAMAAGVPTIVSKQSGVAEAITTAVELDHWDVDGIAGEILALLGDDARCRRMSEAGRSEALGYRWSDVAARVEALYCEANGRARVPQLIGG